MKAQHRPGTLQMVASELQLCKGVHCSTHNNLIKQQQQLQIKHCKTPSKDVPAKKGGVTLLQRGRVLTICSQELDRRPIGRLGQPDVQILLLASFKENHAAAAL